MVTNLQRGFEVQLQIPREVWKIFGKVFGKLFGNIFGRYLENNLKKLEHCFGEILILTLKV